MDEMQALRELRADVGPAAPRRMAALRAGLLRSMHAPPPPRRRMPKLVWRLGLACVLTVALLAGITIAQGNPSDGPAKGPLQPLQPRPANAAVFLDRAADQVARQPSQQKPLQDGQWVYIRDLGSNKTQDDKGREKVDITKQEFWFRFDGEEFAGRIGTGGLDRFPVEQAGDPDFWYPARVRDFQAKLPLDPDRLLAAVHAEVKRMHPKQREFHQGRGLDSQTVWLISELLGADVGVLPTPELQAAMYRALAKVPGIKVTENVIDLAGRRSVVLDYTWGWYQTGIVLDPTSYAYRGAAWELKDGKVYTGSARLQAAIVDQPGQLP